MIRGKFRNGERVKFAEILRERERERFAKNIRVIREKNQRDSRKNSKRERERG